MCTNFLNLYKWFVFYMILSLNAFYKKYMNPRHVLIVVQDSHNLIIFMSKKLFFFQKRKSLLFSFYYDWCCLWVHEAIYDNLITLFFFSSLLYTIPFHYNNNMLWHKLKKYIYTPNKKMWNSMKCKPILFQLTKSTLVDLRFNNTNNNTFFIENTSRVWVLRRRYCIFVGILTTKHNS